MIVAVGSHNPVKLQAVKTAFKKVFPEKQWEIIAVTVSSRVSNQPMSDKESILGARNRATQALKETQADFGVGLEGGLQEIEGKWFDCGWIVVLSKDGKEGIGSTIRLETPEKVINLIRKGKELGEVNDLLFGITNSKHKAGHFGLMTNNAITRIAGYRDGIISALSYFLHPEIFS